MDVTNAVGESLTTNQGVLEIIEFLGKGKSGYSYLAKNNNGQYVAKLMHDEPCAYYSFAGLNKVEIEVFAYNKLKNVGIQMPALIDANMDKKFIIKEYIEGDLVTELIVNNNLPHSCVEQVFIMSEILKLSALNIDYFPDNFVLSNGILYYVDYEHNPYDRKWDLGNWGLYYWANSAGMKAFKETKDSTYINESVSSGVPIKAPFIETVNSWVQTYERKLIQ